MSRAAKFFLIVIAPVLAMLLALLGVETLRSNPLIRHPAYAGYFLMALGISLGYSSLAGLAAILVVLLPGLIYRMNVEEKLLTEHFGEAYRQYTQVTKRLIPGIWQEDHFKEEL